ncbi:unnamed protein product [Litomosoides sigmodontis]|uniref:Uncharacterized protein n=1 Tax=Litomosoides sigmodontis TaxID=42156 RepID=A0A3P6S3J2_LITSI|nr:unnamed protein product [Litomosoides sigmodontis]
MTLSEGCLSEAGSSGLQNRSSAEELQDDCPKCVAMRLNTITAEEALASLSGQFKNLQKELKKTEQVSKINEEQAKYIDERRSKLEKLEAEHTSLYAEYENLRKLSKFQISHNSLKRQYGEVVATARRNQRLVEESVKYHETCKLAMENLMAEKEARQELLTKYLKSVEAASKINDSMKQLEKKCTQLQAVNEKLEPFKYHCPTVLRLLLEFGEIVENNGLMTKSLQKRLARYKDRDDLREYLLRKTRRLTNLSESSTRTIEESSDDDELAQGVENLLLTIGSPSRLRSPKKSVSAKEEIRNFDKNDDHSANSMKEILNVKADEEGNCLGNQLENVEAPHVPVARIQANSDVCMERTQTCRRRVELIEKHKEEKLCTEMGKEKDTSDDFINLRTPSTSSRIMANKEQTEKDVQQCHGELQENILPDAYENNSKSVMEKGSKNTSEVETSNQSNEGKEICENNDRLFTWLSFAHLDPLLPEISRPKFLDAGTFELSKQHGSDDYMDNLFGPLSPSISSRRTSASSTDSFITPKNKTKQSSEIAGAADIVSTAEETCFLAEPLVPAVPGSHGTVTVSVVGLSGASENSNSLCYVPTSTLEAATIIWAKASDDTSRSIQLMEDSESMQNFEVSDEVQKTLHTEALVLTIQTSEPNITTIDSECVVPLHSQRKLNEVNSQSQNECLEVGDDSPELSKITVAKSIDTKEDELKETPSPITQQRGNEEMTRERAVPSKASYSKEEHHFVMPQRDEKKSVVEMLRDESAELQITQNDKKFETCIDNPILQGRSLQHSPGRKQLRIDSRLPKDNQELITDVNKHINVPNNTGIEVGFTQEENVNTKPSDTTGNRILNDGCITTQGGSKKEILNLTASWNKSDERKSSKSGNNSEKHKISSITKSENQVAHSLASQTEGEVTLKNGLENSKIAAESLSENVRIRESKKLGIMQNNEKMAGNTRKRKLAEEGASKSDDKWEDVNQAAVFSVNSKMSKAYGKEPVNEDSKNTKKAITSVAKAHGAELSNHDDDVNRSEIVTNDVEISSNKTKNALGGSNNFSGSEKTRRAKVVAKKSVSTVKSEMYRKMHKRLTVQTSCMKDLGRVQLRKPTENKIPVFSTLKKVEQPNIIQRKRTAIVLPIGRDGLKKAKNAAAIQRGEERVGASSTKVLVGSDEAAVLCLFDQALSENNFNDRLLEIVQKFQTPAISAISCDKLAECSVKFINKLDVGNMWHSVVLAVRYWSTKQTDRCTGGKVLELHQVASSKERNFIEVLHQLSGEEHWGDIISSFFGKMIALMMKTRPVSVAQHGLSIRCILLCTRILLQDGSDDEVLRKVASLLERLIERDSSDRVVPMMCYSVAIVPEIVDKLLFEKNEQYEPIRRVMSVHLASRDELMTIFNKVIMSRLNNNAYSDTCLQKLNADGFHRWFSESTNNILMDIRGLDLEAMELSPRISSAIMTCCAFFSLATNRLVPDKEAVVVPVLNECIQIISDHFESEKEGRNEVILADSAGLHSQLDEMLVKTVLRLLLFGRLTTSFVKSTEFNIFPQIGNLVEEIYRLREFARQKLDQGELTEKNRLLYFGLNDWLRVVKPCTKYLHAAFKMSK